MSAAADFLEARKAFHASLLLTTLTINSAAASTVQVKHKTQ